MDCQAPILRRPILVAALVAGGVDALCVLPVRRSTPPPLRPASPSPSSMDHSSAGTPWGWPWPLGTA